MTKLSESALAEVVYGECPAEDIALAKTLLLPEPIAPGATPLEITAELDNTILLCSRHHRLLHDGAFEIKSGPEGDWQFRRN